MKHSRTAVPIAFATGATALAGCALSVAATAAAGPAAGAGAVVLAAGTAAVLGERFGRRLRALRSGASCPGTAFEELAELARTIEGLSMRVKVADEVAERHRRTAETSSAGMFELLSGLVAAEEATRGQLSAELHDTVAQSLALARAELAVGHSDNIRRAADYVDDAEEQVRAVMARTRPPALREGDLASAMNGLSAELHQRYALRVELRWPPSPYPIPMVTAVAIYRFFQEGLLNVVKHADVDWAEATLAVEEDVIVATVEDAGPGFDPSDVRPSRGRHVGLGLLRERARLAGGVLDISSMPAAGTVLRLTLPRAGVPGRAGDPTLPRVASLSR